MVRAAYVDKNGVKRGAWSEEEDHKLRAYVLRYGHWNWRSLPKYAGLQRCGKSCRLRWMNYLKPGVKRGNYTKEEEDLIAKLHLELGNKWSAIAEKLPGRTDNDIKNYWHAHLKKRSKTGELGQQQQQQQQTEIFQKENSSEIAHHKNFEEKPEVSSDVLYILDSSRSSNSVVPCTVSSGLDQNFSGMLSGSPNSLSFRWEVNDDCASSSDSFPGFLDSFWPDPFMVDAPSTQDFDFTQWDEGGLFSTLFPTFDSYDANNLFQQ